jgi:hypothetical protein
MAEHSTLRIENTEQRLIISVSFSNSTLQSISSLTSHSIPTLANSTCSIPSPSPTYWFGNQRFDEYKDDDPCRYAQCREQFWESYPERKDYNELKRATEGWNTYNVTQTITDDTSITTRVSYTRSWGPSTLTGNNAWFGGGYAKEPCCGPCRFSAGTIGKYCLT